MKEEMWIMKPCKYDRFSPCECCGKCAPRREVDEDEAYSRWKGDREQEENDNE